MNRTALRNVNAHLPRGQSILKYQRAVQIERGGVKWGTGGDPIGHGYGIW